MIVLCIVWVVFGLFVNELVVRPWWLRRAARKVQASKLDVRGGQYR